MSQFLQAVAGGLVQGALYGLIAAGFGLIMAVTKRFHFAISATFVLAVYVAASLVESGVPGSAAILAGLLAGAVAGILIEVGIYAPIVRRAPDAALLGVFVAALGVVIFAENFTRLVWGNASRQIDPGITPERIELADGVGLTNVDLMALGVSVALLAVLWAFLRYSSFGREIRAVEQNEDLATAIGINPRRVGWAVFAIGSVLAGVAAMFFAMRGAVAPSGGQGPTFIALVVAFLAGLRSSPLRFCLAGMLIGVVEALAAVYISSSWSSVVVFGLLFLYIVATAYADVFLRLRLRMRRRRGGAPVTG